MLIMLKRLEDLHSEQAYLKELREVSDESEEEMVEKEGEKVADQQDTTNDKAVEGSSPEVSKVDGTTKEEDAENKAKKTTTRPSR